MKTETPASDLEHVVNYTLVALAGMLAGFLIGSVYCSGANYAAAEKQAPSVPHPRSLNWSKP